MRLDGISINRPIPILYWLSIFDSVCSAIFFPSYASFFFLYFHYSRFVIVSEYGRKSIEMVFRRHILVFYWLFGCYLLPSNEMKIDISSYLAFSSGRKHIIFYARKVLLAFAIEAVEWCIKSSLLFCYACGQKLFTYLLCILKTPSGKFKRIESNNWSRWYGISSISTTQRPKRFCTMHSQIVVTARGKSSPLCGVWSIFGSIFLFFYYFNVASGVFVRWTSYVHSHRLQSSFLVLLNIFHSAVGAKCSTESAHTHTKHEAEWRKSERKQTT